ncbi:RiPP maturation radical SAM C-methyltransferase [Actinomadura barringtoniae]|uniref:RiPP maturation radical SAM C-methyltransferase n=1 Tax=Actinomadura barringtoniae TaxID=1427535 RepID=A0A939PCL0_9ACTN|nr:RiPP maturation radical SAM C-methyltransferase [Actinomadura barringtoniae]MBO2450125.1 RiPP maturation radical SAM C-methyltransferase [Actinomadura barringtoniae]
MSAPLRVLLISMPWHALDRPAIGLSLLQAALRRDGVHCDVRHLGFAFADRTGLDDYRWVSAEMPTTAFAGDWIFTRALYGDGAPGGDTAYAAEVLSGAGRRAGQILARLRRVRAHCEPFLEDCLEMIDWAGYDVVGFTSTFEQNIASLALARRVKERHPQVVVAFGGANWEGEMGEELHARFPFVDAVCQGEADRSFPEYVRRLRDGADPSDVPGLLIRAGGRTVRTPPARPIADLDALPVPAYDDFFADLSASKVSDGIAPVLLLETARGCWWGARHHCTFCGLNGQTMAFRSKSTERVLAEITEMAGRYGVRQAAVVDNIMDMRYFTGVLPALAEAGAPMDLFYEVKANLTAEQVGLLAKAGVRCVQPGLESLSDHVLALMRKGTTALQNVQMLKWCAEFGVRPEWNLLYGFPGETAEDYAATVDLIDAIDFLQPPGDIAAIRLDRFSPYHGDPAGFGLTDVRPKPAYAHLYPFPDETLRRIAFYFDFDYADGRVPAEYAAPAIERAWQWASGVPRGELTLLHRPDGDLVLLDTRPGAAGSLLLSGWQAAVYERCDRVTAEHVAVEAGTGQGATASQVRRFLTECRERRVMAGVGDRWLSLGVRRPARA